MGSEGPSIVTVHVTGFKKFHGVAENPTEKIVSNLKSFMEKRGLPKNLVLGSCTVLETAGEGALDTLLKFLETSIADRENGLSAQGQVIWVSSQLTIDLIVCSRIKINETAFRYLAEIYMFYCLTGASGSYMHRTALFIVYHIFILLLIYTSSTGKFEHAVSLRGCII
jgi:hypothetical protein